MNDYDDHIFKHTEVNIGKITGDHVYEAFTNTNPSAEGLDSWEPAELKLLSLLPTAVSVREPGDAVHSVRRPPPL